MLVLTAKERRAAGTTGLQEIMSMEEMKALKYDATIGMMMALTDVIVFVYRLQIYSRMKLN